MASRIFELELLFLCMFSFCFLSPQAQNLQTYIIQLHPQANSKSFFSSKLHWHLSFIDNAISSEEDSSSRLLYSYGSAMEGFAARLSKQELEILQQSPEIVAIRPDRRHELHTTYSYKFLGLNPAASYGAWQKSGFGRGAIIGILDTGIWPESPSFDDHAMPPVPQRWRGICQEGQDFNAWNCNRKIIGARFFTKGHNVASVSSSTNRLMEYASPRDSQGHGTHTASTAGGSPVPMASVLGNGAGEARGMAPGAHIAIYKVCWFNGCYSSDILAAMDLAIRDGVDVLSLSLGGFPVPLYDDTVAIGSFRAVEHGISVVCAAGNDGPSQSSVANEAPWIVTVGASTLDRRFPALVQMGNGKVLYGESMYPGAHVPTAEKRLGLVYVTGGQRGSEFCLEGSLPNAKVRGKMVVCDRGVNGRAEKGEVVKKAGGAAMIIANTAINLEEDSADAHVLPATLIGFDESIQLKDYINSFKNPTARIIFGGTKLGKARAPAVAPFSSRGPSFTDPSILKPDMVAPGVNIIAAWPQNLGPTALPEDSRRVNFSVMSGTSMACPHVSGISALIHSAYPKWTPAAIRSALMTTADITDHRGKPIMDGDQPAGPFALGAGHVNPEKAINPGLVYDILPTDYIIHLCSLGYTRSEVFSITHQNVSCHDLILKNRGFTLNYPSISVIFRPSMTRKIIKRHVTNVGRPNSIYSVEVTAPVGVIVRVTPRQLIFNQTSQILSYRVWFVSRIQSGKEKTPYAQGSLTWINTNGNRNSYRVRSPISVTWASK